MPPEEPSDKEDATYNGEAISQPPQRWTKAEQLELLMWHPTFTGKCPKCGEQFSSGQVLDQNWKCDRCGWSEGE
jgi:hypothetical protein